MRMFRLTLVVSEGLRPSDSLTRALGRRFAGSLRARGSLAAARSLRRRAVCEMASSVRKSQSAQLREARDGGNRDSREVKREDASRVRQVARIDPAIVRFDAPSAKGKAKAQASPIGAALLKRAE
jgi:hypothetical protein